MGVICPKEGYKAMDAKYKKAFQKFSISYLIVLFLLLIVLIRILDIPNWKDL